MPKNGPSVLSWLTLPKKSWWPGYPSSHSSCTYKPPAASATVPTKSFLRPRFYAIIFLFISPLPPDASSSTPPVSPKNIGDCLRSHNGSNDTTLDPLLMSFYDTIKYKINRSVIVNIFQKVAEDFPKRLSVLGLERIYFH